MKQAGIKAKMQKRFKVTTKSEVFYKRQRRHSTLGYVSPRIFEKQGQPQQIGVGLHTVH